jgi:hypothetical protein
MISPDELEALLNTDDEAMESVGDRSSMEPGEWGQPSEVELSWDGGGMRMMPLRGGSGRQKSMSSSAAAGCVGTQGTVERVGLSMSSSWWSAG